MTTFKELLLPSKYPFLSSIERKKAIHFSLHRAVRGRDKREAMARYELSMMRFTGRRFPFIMGRYERDEVKPSIEMAASIAEAPV